MAAQEEETSLTEVLDSAVAVLEAAVYKKTLRDATYLGGQADYRALVNSVCKTTQAKIIRGSDGMFCLMHRWR